MSKTYRLGQKVAEVADDGTLTVTYGDYGPLIEGGWPKLAPEAADRIRREIASGMWTKSK